MKYWLLIMIDKNIGSDVNFIEKVVNEFFVFNGVFGEVLDVCALLPAFKCHINSQITPNISQLLVGRSGSDPIILRDQYERRHSHVNIPHGFR